MPEPTERTVRFEYTGCISQISAPVPERYIITWNFLCKWAMGDYNSNQSGVLTSGKLLTTATVAEINFIGTGEP